MGGHRRKIKKKLTRFLGIRYTPIPHNDLYQIKLRLDMYLNTLTHHKHTTSKNKRTLFSSPPDHDQRVGVRSLRSRFWCGHQHAPPCPPKQSHCCCCSGIVSQTCRRVRANPTRRGRSHEPCGVSVESNRVLSRGPEETRRETKTGEGVN